MLNGFVSYSHVDKQICDQLRKQLSILARRHEIEHFWVDDLNPTGRCFRAGYADAIEKASIFVLLISSDSLNSPEIMNREIPLIETKHKRDKCLILPAIVDDCLWDCITGTTLASPRDKNGTLKPILEWGKQRNGYNMIGKQFDKAISDYLGKPAKQLFDWNLP